MPALAHAPRHRATPSDRLVGIGLGGHLRELRRLWMRSVVETSVWATLLAGVMLG